MSLLKAPGVVCLAALFLATAIAPVAADEDNNNQRGKGSVTKNSSDTSQKRASDADNKRNTGGGSRMGAHSRNDNR